MIILKVKAEVEEQKKTRNLSYTEPAEGHHYFAVDLKDFFFLVTDNLIKVRVNGYTFVAKVDRDVRNPYDLLAEGIKDLRWVNEGYTTLNALVLLNQSFSEFIVGEFEQWE